MSTPLTGTHCTFCPRARLSYIGYNITSAGAVDREFVIYFGVRCRTLSPICCRCGVLGFPFAPLEFPGAPFGSLWVTLGLPLVPFGSPSGSLWFPLGHPWAPFGSLWATLGLPLVPKARICRQRRLEGILGEAWTSKWAKLMEGLSNIDMSEFRSGVRFVRCVGWSEPKPPLRATLPHAPEARMT